MREYLCAVLSWVSRFHKAKSLTDITPMFKQGAVTSANIGDRLNGNVIVLAFSQLVSGTSILDLAPFCENGKKYEISVSAYTGNSSGILNIRVFDSGGTYKANFQNLAWYGTDFATASTTFTYATGYYIGERKAGDTTRIRTVTIQEVT